MKIAQIAPPWITIPPRHYGGTENVIYHLVEELVALGHDVTLLAPGDARTSAQTVSFIPESLTAEGVPWYASLKAYYHLHKSIEYITKHHFDIVHSHLSSSGDMFLFPLSTFLAAPHITTLHSHFPFDRGPQQWIGDADQQYMDWSSHMHFVAISESARRQQEVPIHFAGVVHHGLPVDTCYDPRRSQEDHFMWLGRFNRAKGAHLAIEAALQAGVPLILAGIKEESNPDAMDYYHNLIEPYLDGKQIRYIGHADAMRKMELFHSARGFLNPIDWEEPFGMVLIEAMASGCPVISFARGAIPEIVTHGVSGFLADNVAEMVYYMGRIDELDRASVHAYTRRHFSARAMAENYLHIYQQMINEPTILPAQKSQRAHPERQSRRALTA